MSKLQVVGIVGSVIVFSSALLPFATGSENGTGTSLFGSGLNDGWVVAGVALMCLSSFSAVLVISRRRKWLWVTASVSALALVVSAVAVVLTWGVGLSWGLGVGAAGVTLLFACAAFND